MYIHYIYICTGLCTGSYAGCYSRQTAERFSNNPMSCRTRMAAAAKADEATVCAQ